MYPGLVWGISTFLYLNEGQMYAVTFPDLVNHSLCAEELSNNLRSPVLAERPRVRRHKMLPLGLVLVSVFLIFFEVRLHQMDSHSDVHGVRPLPPRCPAV